MTESLGLFVCVAALICPILLIRNMLVFRFVTKILKEDNQYATKMIDEHRWPDGDHIYHKRALCLDYTNMLFAIWVWDLNKFLPRGTDMKNYYKEEKQSGRKD